MENRKKERTYTTLGIVFVVILFIVSSYFVQTNVDFLKEFLGRSFFSMVIYVSILIISIVLAPVTAIPLIPIASGLWGWFLAGLLSIVGWTVGSMIAFFLSREYGLPFVKKIMPVKKIKEWEDFVPREHIFLSIVFLRIAVPVDLLSYILGLFSRIKFRDYSIATFIGLSPMAFTLSYLGTLPLGFQMLMLLAGVLLLLLGFMIALKYKKSIHEEREREKELRRKKRAKNKKR